MITKVAIHSAPRSGSTWLGNIFNSSPRVKFSYQPLFSYAFKDYLNENSNSDSIQQFFDLILKSDDSFINQQEGIDKKIIPSFIKADQFSHNCYKEVRYHNLLSNMMLQDSELRLILLIRNPLAVLYSWRLAPREFRSDLGWDFTEEWRFAAKKNQNNPESFYGYEKWKESTELFLNLKTNHPERVMLVTYDEMISNIEDLVFDLFKFVNLEVEEQTLNFLSSSKAMNHSDAYSVYKKKSIDNAWKELPSQIIDYVFKDLVNTQLDQFLNEK